MKEQKEHFVEKTGSESQVNKVEPPKQVEKTTAKNRVAGFFEERLHISVLNYSIPEHANTIWYALGGTAFISFLLLIVSGILMTQFYDPSITGAHESINYISDKAPLGWFVRGIHHWAANIMFALILIHLGRIIVTGSYKKPREFTYYAGLILFFLVFTMVSTGTIVKWDQEGFEALMHFVGISGLLGYLGQAFTPAATPSTHIISRIYSLHISIIPMAIAAVIVFHFYLIKVLKISPLPWKPRSEQKDTATYTQHIRLLIKTGLGAIALIMILALIFKPPFGAAPVNMETGTKPPWLFLWLYALENQVGLAGILYGMIGLFGTLAILPLIDRSSEIRPGKRRIAIYIACALVAVLIGLSVVGYLSPPVVHSQM